jgi:hypothetical protein
MPLFIIETWLMHIERIVLLRDVRFLIGGYSTRAIGADGSQRGARGCHKTPLVLLFS